MRHRFVRMIGVRKGEGVRQNRFLTHPGAVEISHHATSGEDHATVSDRQNLRQFGRGDQHRRAVGRKLADDVVDLDLRADVDAVGRFVEQQDLGSRQQRTREQGFLLIAARQGHDRLAHVRHSDIERLRQPAGLGGLLAAVDEA